jgi:hypothetical protein
METIKQEVKPSFKPVISEMSIQIDRALTGSEQARTELIYSYAHKYSTHKEQLREYYRSQQEHHRFSPAINSKSQ